jgi:hypothetical protein
LVKGDRTAFSINKLKIANQKDPTEAGISTIILNIPHSLFGCRVGVESMPRSQQRRIEASFPMEELFVQDGRAIF